MRDSDSAAGQTPSSSLPTDDPDSRPESHPVAGGDTQDAGSRGSAPVEDGHRDPPASGAREEAHLAPPEPPAATPPSDGASDTTYLLVQRARTGDETARDRLFGLYVDRVRRVVRLRLGSRLRRRVEVNDLVQSVLLHAVRDFDQFEYRGEGAFFHWLNRIVENRVRDRLKHEMRAKRDIRRDQSMTGSLTSSTLDPTAQLPTPSRIMQRREELDRIEAAIDELPHDMREVIILRKYENLSWKEIADEFGQNEGVVRRLFARALNKLAHAVKDLDDSDGAA